MRGVTDTNGYGGTSPDHASSDSEGEEASAGSGGEGTVELLAEDLELPARALASLNALRKSRQHFDVLLVAGGEETPAHKAVLAAASPYLLETLTEPLHRVADVDASSLRALVEWAYTGRLVAGVGAPARKLYEAAWRLRVEGARQALAERLVRRATPQDALELRSLPDLPPQHRHHLDTFIAAHFDEICASGALAALPSVTAELLRESSAEDGGEAPRAVADAALVWLRERPLDEELYARTHLLFVDGGGELRDCGELPAARTDAPELQEYRREAVERRRREPAIGATTPKPLAGGELGARERTKGAGGDCAVLAARALGPRATQALLAVRGRLLAARVAWRPAGGPVARGGKLGHTQDAPPEPDGERRAELAGGRCAHGAAALGQRLLVCGGYDRARVLRGCEAYCPAGNAWSARAHMRGARARFPAAAVRGRLYALGGSDGHHELDTVDAFEEGGENGLGKWVSCARLPGARSHAAAAADEARGALYVLGGWAGGRSLKAVHRYDPETDTWSDVLPLTTGRSQCAAVSWRGSLWALGGCDAWRCLASTELLSLDDPEKVEIQDWPELKNLVLADPGYDTPAHVDMLLGAEVYGLTLTDGIVRNPTDTLTAQNTSLGWILSGTTHAGWSPGPLLPSARRSMGGCAWRGRLVLAGGSDGAASLRRVDWLMDTQTGATWQAGPPLRRARAGLGLAELGGALYAAGGFSGREFLACVEWLPAPDAEWTMLADPPQVARTLSEPNPPSESDPPAVCRAVSEPSDTRPENGQGEASAP